MIAEPVGSMPLNMPVVVSGIAASVAACGFGLSSLCVQQSHLGERTFLKIILQRERSNLGVEYLRSDSAAFVLGSLPNTSAADPCNCCFYPEI